MTEYEGRRQYMYMEKEEGEADEEKGWGGYDCDIASNSER